ncbi:hypothetical protein PYCCODRAFT_733339 [Trametes coccinea BRFM310]|uniref:Uncharacterized protein n=1 Tax=Trametes coccinea (strain BRFM310) TaxID=1353009 RepID=A0A1Y2IFH3_TRAC3|nr:hypothetical protein PYCCODRAFT_733339 [Trametes coccinea BRFM310]
MCAVPPASSKACCASKEPPIASSGQARGVQPMSRIVEAMDRRGSEYSDCSSRPRDLANRHLDRELRCEGPYKEAARSPAEGDNVAKPARLLWGLNGRRCCEGHVRTVRGRVTVFVVLICAALCDEKDTNAARTRTSPCELGSGNKATRSRRRVERETSRSTEARVGLRYARNGKRNGGTRRLISRGC